MKARCSKCFEEGPIGGFHVICGGVFDRPIMEEAINPKDRFGLKKPPLHLIPAVAELHEAMAFGDGARKYGPYNWREKNVIASIYVAAALRHIKAWYDGQECAEDSGVHHLGHARACLAIILDAQAMPISTLEDDRPIVGSAASLLAQLTKKD